MSPFIRLIPIEPSYKLCVREDSNDNGWRLTYTKTKGKEDTQGENIRM